MARPIKNNADFFPHDSDMRNDDRIKALRKRFKLQGYAIWNMLIEYIAGREFFRFEYNEFTLELIAGDFDADVHDIQEVISYCLTLKLLQEKDGFIECSTLEKKLEPLLSKRKYNKDKVSETITPVSATITPQTGGLRDKSTQSKVKESKGEGSKEPANDDLFKTKAEVFEYLKGNYIVMEDSKKIVSAKGWRAVDEVDIVGFIKIFVSAKAKMDQPPKEILYHFKNWLFREPVTKLTEYAMTHKQSLR